MDVSRTGTMKNTEKDNLCKPPAHDSLGKLAGGVADDFNNILTVIIGACSLLEMNAADNPEQMQFVSRIRCYAERAAQLTQSLVELSAGQPVSLQFEDLRGIFREMLSFLEQIIGNNIRIVARLPEQALMAMIDHGQFEQVFMSLAAYSRDAMPSGGVLNAELSPVLNDGSVAELTGFAPGEYACMTFSDTGEGLDSGSLHRMFEPCFSLYETGVRSEAGLTVARDIVSRHGGVIHVRSEPGQGTTFTIYLPCVIKI